MVPVRGHGLRRWPVRAGIRATFALATLFALFVPPAAWAATCNAPTGRCCDYCMMWIESDAFGGEIVTRDGRRLAFDAIECIAASRIVDSTAVRSVKAIDHARPGMLLDVRRAGYLRSAAVPSPMAVNLSAYASPVAARAARVRAGEGDVLSWAEVMDLVRRSWFPAADTLDTTPARQKH